MTDHSKPEEWTLPEIYEGCAHPQAVWFEEHWRPIFEKLKFDNERLWVSFNYYKKRILAAYTEAEQLREALNKILKEVGTSTLAHKIAREALESTKTKGEA